VGLGAAARIAVGEMDAERATLRRLRDLLEHGIRAGLDGVTRNGHPERRLAGNLNVSFDGVNGEELLAELRDLAVSSGAACATGALEPSHVLTAIGVPPERAAATVRFGLGRFTTERDVFTAIETVVAAVRKLRSSRMPLP
jgi:cysteine desulfurase